MKHAAIIFDFFFCIFLLPLMGMLVPIDKWIVDNTGFVALSVMLFYAIYFVNRYVAVPFIFHKNRPYAGLMILVLTAAAVYLLTEYPMQHPADHEVIGPAFDLDRRSPEFRELMKDRIGRAYADAFISYMKKD